jgi:hypothetical protein
MLSVFESQPNSSVWPWRALACPLCRGKRLQVQSTSVGGWGHCRKCGFRGTALDLMQAAWKLTWRGTVNKAVRTGVLASKFANLVGTESYDACVRLRQARCETLWADAQTMSGTYNSEDMRVLQGKLRLDTARQPRDVWLEGPGQYVGVSTTKTLAASLRPADRQRGTTPQQEQLRFHGKGWNHILMFPMFDAPTHHTGYLCVGRDGDPEDFVYVYTGIPRTTVRHRTGLAMLPTAASATARLPFDGTAFVIPDVVMATRLQMRQLKTATTPVPVVGLHLPTEPPGVATWRAAGLRDVVFWAPHGVTLALLQAARIIDGRIAMPSTVWATPLSHMTRSTPRVFLRELKAAAISWLSALAVLLKADLDAVEDVLLQLHLTDAELLELHTCATADVRSCITEMRATRDSQPRRAVVSSRDTVTQTAAGWSQGSVQLCSGVLHIDRVLYNARTAARAYTGEIRWRGHAVQFCVTEQDIEAAGGAFRWMDNCLLAAGYGPLEYVDSWSSRAIRVAQQFHPPAVVAGLEGVGWSDVADGYVFPAFTLDTHGKAEPLASPQLANTPCLNFEPPTSLSASTVEALSAVSTASQLFWAVATTVISNALAVPNHAATPGTLLLGDGAAVAGVAAAKQLGCPEFQMAFRSRAEPPWAAFVKDHNWPCVITQWTVRSQACPRPLAQWLTEEPRNVLFAAKWLAGQSLAIGAPWHVIETFAPATELQLRAEHAHGVAPCFLQHKLQTDLAVASVPGVANFAARVNHELAAWFEQLGGKREAVERAMAVLQPAGGEYGRLDRFAEVLCHLYMSGWLTVADDDFPQPATGLPAMVRKADGTVFIPAAAVNAALSRLHVPLIDMSLVAAAMQAAHVLREPKGEATIAAGWHIEASWWDAQVRTAKARFRCRNLL